MRRIDHPGALPQLDGVVVRAQSQHGQRPVDRFGQSLGFNVLGGSNLVVPIEEIAAVSIHARSFGLVGSRSRELIFPNDALVAIALALDAIL
jgi:hypothetical protein